MRKWIDLIETWKIDDGSPEATIYDIIADYVTAGENANTEGFDEVYGLHPRPALPMRLYRVLRLQPYQMDDFRAGKGFDLRPMRYSSWTKSLDSAELLAQTKGHNTIILTHTFPPEEVVIDIDDFYREHNLHHLDEYRRYVEAEQEVIVRHSEPFRITSENSRAFEAKAHAAPKVGDEVFYFNEEDPYAIEEVSDYQPNAARGIFFVTVCGDEGPVRYIGEVNGKQQWEFIDHLLHEGVISQTTFYHGSRTPLPQGTRLTARADGYVAGSQMDKVERTAHNRCEALIEKYRPEGAPSRSQAVFLVTDPDHIDYAGGYVDHIYEVSPATTPWRANLAWYSDLYLLCEDDEVDEQEAEKLARNYWAALNKGKGDLFEYLVTSAVVGDEIDA